MPWIKTEQKEREHSKPVRDRYARSARAQTLREELSREGPRSVPLWPMLAAMAGLAAAYACVLYLLGK